MTGLPDKPVGWQYGFVILKHLNQSFAVGLPETKISYAPKTV